MTRTPLRPMFASLLLSLCATQASAQSLVIGSTKAYRGETAHVAVSFVASPTVPIAAFDIRIPFDRLRFHTPTCTPANPISHCYVNPKGSITMLSLAPYDWLNTQTSVMLHFPVRSTAPAGIAPLVASDVVFVSPEALEVDGTVHSGGILIL